MTDPGLLIRRAKSGDNEAFQELYQTFFTPIYRYLLSETRHLETAEDMAQTVFVKAWQHLRRSAPNDNENDRAYFFRIARTTLIDHWRKKRESLFGETEEFDHIPSDDDPAKEAERNENVRHMHQALSKLPPEQREVLLLRFMGDASHGEIADTLGKSDMAVRQIQHRAIRKLASLLSPHV